MPHEDSAPRPQRWAEFLDTWGREASAWGWTGGDLFAVTDGLIWQLAGHRVVALWPGHARLDDGRTVSRAP